MNLFDIVGPIMVGPSSSHTAGAVKIGRISRKLLAEPVAVAKIYFHGSFQATGKGHGTDKAVIAGLLGMEVDDADIPRSFEVANQNGMKFEIQGADLGDAHPNSVKLNLEGVSGQKLEIIGASIGGGQIEIRELNGLPVSFSGDYPTLAMQHIDQPGSVRAVTTLLAYQSVNIATMQLDRAKRGGNAVLIVECDQEVPREAIEAVQQLQGLLKVNYLSLL